MTTHLALAERLAAQAESVAVRGKMNIRQVEGKLRLAELTLRRLKSRQEQRRLRQRRA
jgi:hypothetical protein